MALLQEKNWLCEWGDSQVNVVDLMDRSVFFPSSHLPVSQLEILRYHNVGKHALAMDFVAAVVALWRLLKVEDRSMVRLHLEGDTGATPRVHVDYAIDEQLYPLCLRLEAAAGVHEVGG